MHNIILTIIIAWALWPANVVAQNAGWTFRTEADPMSDETHAYADTPDVDGQRAELRIGCSTGQYASEYVALDVHGTRVFDAKLVAGRQAVFVETRIDTLPFANKFWDVSKDFQTAYAPDSVPEIIEGTLGDVKNVLGPVPLDTLAAHARLTVRVDLAFGRTEVFRFNLRGAQAALAKVRAACNAK